MLKERQQNILAAVISEHIRTAHPVASQDILERLELALSPATIRNEMQELDEKGYLKQPYTSAGRVPTDKGYRFFVDNLITRSALARTEEHRLDEAFENAEIDEFIKSFSRSVSEISGTFAAVGMFDEDMFYDNGLTDILDEPEFEEAETMRSFGRLVDLLDEVVPALFQKCHIKEEAIFIGEENPLKEAKNYAMSISRWRHPHGFEGFVAMVGPRRARYEKHIAILQYLDGLRSN